MSSYGPNNAPTPPPPPPKSHSVPPTSPSIQPPTHPPAIASSYNTAPPRPPPPPQAYQQSYQQGHQPQQPGPAQGYWTASNAGEEWPREESTWAPQSPYNDAAPPQHQQPPQQAPPSFPPLEDGWLPPSLRDMSKQDLQHLLSTPALQTHLLHAPATAPPALKAPHPDNTPLATLHAQLARNAALAAHVEQLVGALEDKRNAAGARLLAVRGLEAQWRRRTREVEEKVAPWSARRLYQGLVGSIGEAEGRVKGVEEGFLEGEGVRGEREVGEWVRRVREGRGVVALRRERRARWDEGRVGGWR